MQKIAYRIFLGFLLCFIVSTQIFCQEQDDFEFHIENDEIVITGYLGTSVVVSIPAEIDSLAVRVIGSYAFQHSEISEVLLPDSIREIQAQAFADCRNLRSINLSSQLVTIGVSAFEGAGIHSISLPDTLKVLGDSAFASCQSLSSIQFPSDSSELSVGDDVFRDCDGLLEVTFTSGFRSIPEGMFSYCNNLRAVTLNDDVESIAPESFSWCRNLQFVNFPEGLKVIGNDAFVGSGLTEVSLPSSLSSLGSRPFAFSQDLVGISVASGNTAFADIDGVLYDKGIKNLLSYPASKTAVEFQIPNTVESIGLHAFASNTILELISIPSSVIDISDSAFYGNSNLHTVEVQSGNPNYSSKDGVLFDQPLESLLYFPYGKVISFYKIPEGVTAIRGGAFSSRSGIEYVVIPEGVTNVERDTFSDSSLREVVIPSSVQTIESYAFYTSNLSAVYFLGDAPNTPTQVFYRAPNGSTHATGYIFDTAEGFDASPLWQYAYPYSLPIVTMGALEDSTIWKLENAISYDADLDSLPAGLRHPLLLPFALNLDPQMSNFPMPEIGSVSWAWEFYGDRDGVTYIVEKLNDLKLDTWDSEDITVSSPNAEGMRIATGSSTKGNLFLRIRIEEN
ncbi:leucine-rich repeat domain-containing protein [Coraliomargarita sp. W4R72]